MAINKHHEKAHDQRAEVINLLHSNPAALGRLTITEVDNLHRALGLQRK